MSVADALAGLGGGAVIAVLGLGLVLSFRASGVVNLAHAAVGAYLAFAYFEFRDSGDLVLPILGLPARVHLLATPTLATAVVVGLALAVVVGLAIHLLVFRPLRDSSPIARVVASLGLFLYTQELVRLRFPVAGSSVTRRLSILPQGPVRLLGSAVSADRLWLAAFAIGGAAVLTFVYRRTRFGLVTRAAASSDKGALLTGLRPDRAAAGNWVLSTVLAGVAVVLIEPISGLDPTTTSLLVVPALGAALLGGLASFWITTGAGLGIGIAQAMLLGYLVRPGTTWVPSWLPVNGLVQAVPVVIILVALAARGDVVPGRAAVPERRTPPSPTPRRPWVGVLALAGFGLLGALTFDATSRQAMVVSMIASMLALSIVVVTGYAGQMSLAPLAVAGVSGFTLVHLAGVGVPFPVDLLLAAVLGGAVGVAVGSTATRVRGTTFAVATLALAVALEQLALASPSLSGGAAGSSAPRPQLFGLDLGSSARGVDDVRPAFVITVLVVLVMCVAAVTNLRRGPTGLRWLAVRANERAAAAAGIDVARAKLSAFATASVLAGLSGGLTAYSTSTLSPASFMVVGALVAVALTFLGGVSSVAGAIIAGLLAQSGLLASLGRGDEQRTYAWSGIALIAAAIWAPEGIVGLARRAREGVRRRRVAT
ncbi:MAG TPA: ABC transporter permease [Microthrixaceae bacterium]|nr:ABC transporter permease [Microthrixaceae bacterium]